MATDPNRRHAAVIGAGIGGLAAAIALRQAGWEATVYEAAPEVRPLGAGLSIWPNGVRALRQLGLGDLAAAAPRADGALRRADGSVLAEFDPDALEARFEAPLVGFHRADLHEGLVAALGSERVRTGMRLEELETRELRFEDGSSVRADLVVGADGLGSTVREALLGDGEPRDSGIVAFRGVADLDAPVPAGEWWGAGSVAGLLPLGGGRVYWYLAHRGDPDRTTLPGLQAEYGEPVREAFSRTAADQVLVHRLYDRDPVPSWSRGSATLLGDAAHPMLPFLGQGAGSALGDAAALGAAVAAEPDVEAALTAYERARLERTAALVAGSRKAAKAALLESGLGRRLRNALVAKAPESIRLRQLDPFVG
ncbi:MAG TPA: FAD-dependent monooxygenase [Solirubrobacterales bacterium]|nr:FAD-dependent monooxygenase [Solirubrobacterales bacterium]